MGRSSFSADRAQSWQNQGELRIMKLFVLCIMLHRLSAQRLDVLPQEYLPEHEAFENVNPPLFIEQPSNLEEFNTQVKRIVDPDSITVQSRMFPKIITSHVSAQPPCSCETEYEIKDLGEGHYPRFLTASHCKARTCQNKLHSCRLLHYMVHILKQRDASSAEEFRDNSLVSESPLPDSLRRKWQLKPLSVPVICVPTMDTKKN